MKLNWLCRLLTGRNGRVLVGAGALAFAAMPATAGELRLWHSLQGYHKEVFEDVIKDFNRSQKDIDVKLKAFDSEEAVEAALAGAKKRDDRPHLVHMDDDRYPEQLAGKPYIQPLHALLAHHPIKNADWFLQGNTAFAHDAKGRLVAFPYMADIPVMFYNTDAFKKAGLKSAAPANSWLKLQDQLVELANNGSRQCPMTSDQPVSIHLENLAALNNQLYVSNENGLKGKGKPAFQFDLLYIRHLSLMISWARSGLLVKPELSHAAAQRFTQGECALLMSSSGKIGPMLDARGLKAGVTGLPYYPEATKTPGRPFVSGSALWVVAGHSKESDASSAKFLSWLAQPDQAAKWHQRTGFLPLTKQAFAATPDSYYKNLGDWKTLVAAQSQKGATASRGFRVDNYPQIHAMLRQRLDNAFNGNEPAVTTLKTAAAEAGKMMGK